MLEGATVHGTSYSDEEYKQTITSTSIREIKHSTRVTEDIALVNGNVYGWRVFSMDDCMIV